MPWFELTVDTPVESVEAVTAILLDAGCQGVAERGVGIGVHRLTGYLHAEVGVDEIAGQVRERLDRLAEYGLPPAEVLRMAPVQEADWANEWRKYFHPVEIGNRLVVKPTWEQYEGDPARAIVEIDPGQAFGTGGHATTRLCLEALDQYVVPGMVVADIGTGSGILALAAAQLGAAMVYATDIDLLPRKVAAENVGRNRLEGVVQVLDMDAFDRAAWNCDLVVANIIATTIIEVTPSVQARLKPGGLYIASGIVDELLPDVESAIAAAGFELVEIRKDEIWRAVVSRRP